MDEAPRFGAGWPDVALALLAFAREDTRAFVLLFGYVTILAGALGVSLVWALIGLRTKFRSKYRSDRRGKR